MLRTAGSPVLLFITAAGLAALALAGCAGSSSNPNAVRIRGIDAATNAPLSDIVVNAGSAFGDMAYFQTTNYQYMGSGAMQFYAETDANSNPVPSPGMFTVSVNSGQYYSLFLVGRGDTVNAGTDVQYLTVLATQDSQKPAIPSGDALVRLVIAAPDIFGSITGSVNVSINGVVPTGFSDQTFQVPNNTFLTAPWVAVPAGTVPVAVQSTGLPPGGFPSTTVVPAQPVTLAAGQAYTILVVEPNGGTPSSNLIWPYTVVNETFGIKVIPD